MNKGKTHIYTGNGKGKTTAALGLAMRAVGHGMSVIMIQFMKKNEMYGEYAVMSKIAQIEQFGTNEFVNLDNPTDIDISEAESGLKFAETIIMAGTYDVIILDEILVAVSFGLIPEDSVIELMKLCRGNAELILTGRGASDVIIDEADLVTEMCEIKHYYSKGIIAREGVEY